MLRAGEGCFQLHAAGAFLVELLTHQALGSPGNLELTFDALSDCAGHLVGQGVDIDRRICRPGPCARGARRARRLLLAATPLLVDGLLRDANRAVRRPGAVELALR